MKLKNSTGEESKMTSKCSIKNRALPYRGDPTRAAYQKPVMGEGKYIHVIPSVYNPMPAPIPSRKPAPKPKSKKPSKAKPRRDVQHAPKYWTKERIKTLIELYEQGLIYEDIAAQMGTTRSAVNSKLSRLVRDGVITHRAPIDQLEQEDIDRLVEMKKKGMTIGEISDVLGKSKKSCYAAWRRWNDKQNCMLRLCRGMDDGRSKP